MPWGSEFKPRDSSPQDIAANILAMPLDGVPHENSHEGATFESCLVGALKNGATESKAQELIFGNTDHCNQAADLLFVLRKIKEVPVGQPIKLSHDEREAFVNGLIVATGEARRYNTLSEHPHTKRVNTRKSAARSIESRNHDSNVQTHADINLSVAETPYHRNS